MLNTGRKRAAESREVATGFNTETLGTTRWVLVRMLLDDRIALLSVVVLIMMALGAIGAERLGPYDPWEQNLYARLQRPTLRGPAAGGFPHIAGTDELGRDHQAPSEAQA